MVSDASSYKAANVVTDLRWFFKVDGTDLFEPPPAMNPLVMRQAMLLLALFLRVSQGTARLRVLTSSRYCSGDAYSRATG
jgi:hypothetical protein